MYAINRYRNIIEYISKNQNLNGINGLEFLDYLPEEVIDSLVQWDICFVCIPKKFKQYVDSKNDNKLSSVSYKDLLKGISFKLI